MFLRLRFFFIETCADLPYFVFLRAPTSKPSKLMKPIFYILFFQNEGIAFLIASTSYLLALTESFGNKVIAERRVRVHKL